MWLLCSIYFLAKASDLACIDDGITNYQTKEICEIEERNMFDEIYKNKSLEWRNKEWEDNICILNESFKSS